MSAPSQVRYENTPNPATMKFIFPQPIATESAQFLSASETRRSPLAAKIFGFPWVAGVFIGLDFVTVTKQDWVEWDIIAEPLSHLLEEHVVDNQAVLLPEIETIHAGKETEQTRLIRQILEEEIRPAVAMDGGDIVFHKYEDQVVYVHMQGACAGCPSSMMTLKEGVESRLKMSIPEIIEVVAI